MPQRHRKIVAVDVDGTIVKHRYPKLGGPVPGALVWLKRFVEAGADLILLTMRSGPELDDAVYYLERHGIQVWAVNDNPEQHDWTDSRKVYAHRYIDDAAVGCPLLPDAEDRHPYVDWSEVGPMVMNWLNG